MLNGENFWRRRGFGEFATTEDEISKEEETTNVILSQIGLPPVEKGETYLSWHRRVYAAQEAGTLILKDQVEDQDGEGS